MEAVAVHHERFPRLAINRVGLWLFIASESMLFAGLLAARFFLQGVHRPEALNQVLGLIITSILLASSLTAFRAEASIAHGDRRGFLRHTLATILLGGVFLVGVGFEWAEAFSHFPPTSIFGSVFFTTTGMHAFHVLTGVVMLVLLYFEARRGGFSPDSYWGAEAVVKYWHFVDVVWVFIYPALYLVS